MSVREAAERYRRNAYVKGHFGDDEYRNVGYLSSSDGWNDRAKLSNAYLAEHQADECETITDEWLREVGFVRYTDQSDACYLPADGCKPVVGIAFRGEWLINGTFIGTKFKTRGQLRKLLEALGVKKKGGSRC